MKRVLEDLFLGPEASPSFSEGVQFRWEDSRRRVRVVFAEVTIAESKCVMRLHEFGRLPVYYFPMEEVRMDLLEATDHQTCSPLKGAASTHSQLGHRSKATWPCTGTRWTPGTRKRNGSMCMPAIPTTGRISWLVPGRCAWCWEA